MTVHSERQSGLGRGLAALIPQRTADPGLTEVPLARIRPNPLQPRRQMDEAELESLAASIADHGVLLPILVTQTLDGYQIVAGERRFRAAQLAGLERIPVVIRQVAGRDQLELALVENLQREDLNPVEEALAFRQLIDEFGLTQEDVAARIGRARSTVANTLRLLDLDAKVQQLVIDGALTGGHARAIGGLPADQQARVAEIVVERDLSTRETEELVRRLREPRADKPAQGAAPRDADLERVEEDLRRTLGTKVTIARSRKGGRIVIEYYSDEELGQLYDRLIGAIRAVDPAKISPSPDLRHALPEYPGAAPPSHGRCMSQKIVNLFRGVACVVNLSAVMRYDAASTAGRLVSATYVHFVGSPAFRLANMPGTVRSLPSSRKLA